MRGRERAVLPEPIHESRRGVEASGILENQHETDSLLNPRHAYGLIAWSGVRVDCSAVLGSTGGFNQDSG